MLFLGKGLLMARRLKSPPFSYRPGNSVFHRFSAGLKLLGLLVLSSLVLTSLHGIALSVLLLIVACVVARIPLWALLKGAKPLIILSLIIMFARTLGARDTIISAYGFMEGVAAALRILVVFTAASFLFAVTTMRELRLSLARLENWIKKKIGMGGDQGIAFFSLGISLMLGFIPRFFEMWETANLACQARSHKRSLRRVFILVPLVTERMMEAAAETVFALEARGLGQGNE